MTRTVSATISTAVGQPVTRPIHLIRMGWDASSPTVNYFRAATWGAAISWNSETWAASGLEVTNLDAEGGTLTMPASLSDPWLALVVNQVPRNRTIQIYEHHTNYTVSPAVSDAVLVFDGLMDEARIGNNIRISLVESMQKKGFPAGRIDRPTYNYLLPPGSKIQWGYDIVMVN